MATEPPKTLKQLLTTITPPEGVRRAASEDDHQPMLGMKGVSCSTLKMQVSARVNHGPEDESINARAIGIACRVLAAVENTPSQPARRIYHAVIQGGKEVEDVPDFRTVRTQLERRLAFLKDELCRYVANPGDDAFLEMFNEALPKDAEDIITFAVETRVLAKKPNMDSFEEMKEAAKEVFSEEKMKEAARKALRAKPELAVSSYGGDDVVVITATSIPVSLDDNVVRRWLNKFCTVQSARFCTYIFHPTVKYRVVLKAGRHVPHLPG
ncbi:Hypp791 [Branchiostoma lanceolatum]|uniref:Hypp791 protein n=1 Tax=Branchiostoma lanceolatum TaxID=7740 RepID=A0A8J9VBQ0_BRALA|nr:Hypp791 [Branchiostoma lanceolatum]